MNQKEIEHALMRAEQTLRNVAFGARMSDDFRQILGNEAANLSDTLKTLRTEGIECNCDIALRDIALNDPDWAGAEPWSDDYVDMVRP